MQFDTMPAAESGSFMLKDRVGAGIFAGDWRGVLISWPGNAATWPTASEAQEFAAARDDAERWVVVQAHRNGPHWTVEPV